MFPLTKKYKVIILRLGILVLLQNAKRLDFPQNIDVVWLESYLVKEVFLNNSI